MAVMVLVDGKILIITILVNLCCLIPTSPGISTKLLLLKYLLSTYTITAISWLPPLISQAFFTSTILNMATPFFTARLF